MQAKPQKQHEWLTRLVGDWAFTSESGGCEGEPPQKSNGTERVRSLGGLWIIAEGQGEMPGGGPAQMVLTLGFDPEKGRFVGTWIGSMMTHMWVYEGTLSEDGRTLTLDTQGPSFADDGSTANYRETIEIVSDNERTFASSTQGKDGSWTTFMTATYRRTG